VARLAAHGVDPRRIVPTPRLHLDEYLSLLGEIDVVLDPFPYNGHVTTCDTLWMGTPVVTLEGSCAAGRVGVGILRELGMNECVARDRREYVTAAVRIAGDGDYRKEMRARLRQRMRASSLMDYRGLVARFEAALEQLWRQGCDA
jgi:protein O-GlcNAc transferase